MTKSTLRIKYFIVVYFIFLSSCGASLKTEGQSGGNNTINQYYGLFINSPSGDSKQIGRDILLGSKQDNEESKQNRQLIFGESAKLSAADLVQNNIKANEYFQNASTLQNDNDAISLYKKAIELKSDFWEAYFNLGLLSVRHGDNTNAIKYYNKYLELDSQFDNKVLHTQAYNNRGIAKANLGDNKGAIKDFDKAIEIDTNIAFAYFNRGSVKARLDDYRAAIKDLTKAIELDPNYVYAYNNLGSAKASFGDPKGAIKDLNKAIELDPNYAYAYGNRGIIEYELGHEKVALEDLLKADKLGLSEVHEIIRKIQKQ